MSVDSDELRFPYTQVDPSVSEKMSVELWSVYEEPVLEVPIKFTFGVDKETGYLMTTNGAVYFFKETLLKRVQLYEKIHVLDMRRIIIDEKSLNIKTNSYDITVKSEKYVLHIFYSFYLTFLRATYGSVDLPFCEYKGNGIEIIPIELSERPKHTFMCRSIFLGHFYGKASRRLDHVKYFNKWERKMSKLLMLDSSFHPGNFAAAFGHAIAWEKYVNTVCFVNFSPGSFLQLLATLIEHSQGVRRLIFASYADVSRIPQFPNFKIDATTIRKWWFARCVPQLIISFLKFTKLLSNSVREFQLFECSLSDEDMVEISEIIRTNDNLRRVKKFGMTRTFHYSFPFEPFIGIIKMLYKLEEVVVRDIYAEGMDFLSIFCFSDIPLISVNLSMMEYFGSLDEGACFSQSIVYLNLGDSVFSGSLFAKILLSLTKQPRRTPLILNLSGAKLTCSNFEKMYRINTDLIFPVISELNLSDIEFPDLAITPLFRFLVSQNEMKYLHLNNVRIEDEETQIRFLHNIYKLSKRVFIQALGISGNFSPWLFSSFIDSLPRKIPNLKRLSIEDNSLTDGFIEPVVDSIACLSSLEEVLLDGSECEELDSVFYAYSILSMNTQSIDLPLRDLRRLGYDSDSIPDQYVKTYEEIMSMRRPTDVKQRITYLTSDSNVPYDDNIFINTLDMDLVDEDDSFSITI